ncbi:MAG: Na+/H+ antiporter subunit C [Proteobacteria bacterium]|jgi:Multisubunit Na+/H+ antiporter, MnhC subunit|nr:MAG: Na+/H+ antiporter subunit C [Pseudomonadota bacterium]
MELILSLGIGLLTATGIYLILRERTFSVLLGITLLSYATNLLIFVSGRLITGRPPLLIVEQERYADPIPQALVLTAIVISFGMTAYLVALALRAKGESGTDHVDAGEQQQ